MENPNLENPDYHINGQFKMTGPADLGPPIFKNNANPQPGTVAPATLRMMGRQHNNTTNHQYQPSPMEQKTHDPNLYQPHQGQNPLMPPFSVPSSNSRSQKGTNIVNTSNTNYNNNKNNDENINATTALSGNIHDITTARNSNRNTAPIISNETKQFHRRSLGDWDFLETVGAGSMGKVKLAKHHQTQEICAIKIVNRATKAFLHKEQSMPPPKNEQEIAERQKRLEKEISRDKRTVREASLGQILYHPHICRLFEMCTMSNHFYMLFEYVSGGQLLDYIIQHGSLREHHARKFARGIASALQYLHLNNIVHRDLKIENIMISNSGEIKIIDFGLSNVFDNRKQLHTFCGSLYFAAPELLKAHPYTGPEVDVWSFGIVLYVLVCGKVPFDDENSSVLHEKIRQGKVEYPNHLSIEVISLLSKMIVVDPAKRASLRQVVEHPWMTRGYDFPPLSYLPRRIPLTPEAIDNNVLREMFRLEFIDDVEECQNSLIKIITEEPYLERSRGFWQLVVKSPSNSSNINGSSVIGNQNVGFKNPFDDPTQAYHPLLSIYHLVHEMLTRKAAKLQRKQAAIAAHQLQILQKQSQANNLEQAADIKSNWARQETIDPMPQTLRNNIPSIDNDIDPSKVQKPKSYIPRNYSPSEKPLRVIVPPKLSVPEQAHTSPTSRKSSDYHNNFVATIATPQSPSVQKDYQQRSNVTSCPSDQEDKNKSFGGLFRKLSQRRRDQVPQQQQQYLHPSEGEYAQTNQNSIKSFDYQQKIPPHIEVPQIQIQNMNQQRSLKTHSRTVSEYMPSPPKMPLYYNYNKQDTEKTATSTAPVRSMSQKKKATMPALPSNAETLVQEQRERQLSKGTDGTLNDQNTDKANQLADRQDAGRQNVDADENVPLPPLHVTKGRKFHPSARAKSVGHARRESLKFTRPPVPQSVYPRDVEDNGFLEYSDDNRSDSRDGKTTEQREDSKKNITSNVETVKTIPECTTETSKDEMTDEEILAAASQAPVGSMPSIDFPRSLFLKGFFSVQTTSSKPLPIVRYKIISVLNKMHIDFKEVKGGFVCIQRSGNSVEASSPKETQASPSRVSSKTTSIDEQLEQQPQRVTLNPDSQLSPRGTSISRHTSISRQGSISRYGQPNYAVTPLASNNHERTTSIGGTSAFSGRHNRNGSINLRNNSDELSTTSLEYTQQQQEDDMLSTTKIQEMNKVDSDNALNTNTPDKTKARVPLKFEIHIVKVRIVGLAGVHFKKVSGNTWLYKELASDILKELNL
ncbi:serine/threonine protein kinase KIN2 NDAI_0B02070 [Naumovozyma dairenensis CBS 421]|uniref:non-specific serine/threonine protein kinase n=1 Tax=Naumovozyma dairenensis (strain ATCC 10597 / BCRC 20456 / CBS 421 / NBRC 0211 / NRRL Y-12639) TaxID=1071378 RepID=G0W631_NAUDC|nr:hypothetical protein NDAI_0B02070 [Naumovozyma dairenensis CBS 421]CCD23242.1 hypothetical protein NDAI_0B02070 [Naumovozyma dairenensis CBS 421]